MQGVQTPFFVVKRSRPTAEEAMAKWLELDARRTTLVQVDVQDLIACCLSVKEENVFLKIGDKVRLKASSKWTYRTPQSGTATVWGTCVTDAECHFEVTTDDDDYNSCNIRDESGFDLTDLVELL